PTTAPTTAPVAVAEAPVVVPEPAPPKVGNGSPGWFGSSFMRGWEKRFELGFNGSSGTSQTFDLITKFNGKFEDDKHRWKTSAAYYRGSANGNRSRNEFVAQFEKDWLLPQSKWFWFARGRYDYNEFQYWRQRAGGFGGVGYEFAKGPKFDLIGRVGLGASRDFGGDDPKSRPEGLLGVEARWAITDRVTLTGFTTFFPDLTDPRHFRNMSGAGAALTFAVDPSGGMSFKLGVENEYQSFTRDDSPHNALRYFGALVYVF
ncbi:MAG TPA: DUF481 domain-containing protein, partial [Tepidisphaeraceae bacterium]|nr:DUF481 domain-containing protein [Tepidisphaeraceae bacterium]